MIHRLLHILSLPEKRPVTNLDDPETTRIHAAIINRKPFLKKVYQDYYREVAQSILRGPPASPIIELGSGPGFSKEIIPGIFASDVLRLPNVDLCLDALRMPFAASSVELFFMINVLHHIRDAQLFFNEITRCLKPGGRALMIEPANTCFSRFIYRKFHHETFDPTGDWQFPGTGPLSVANGALPWIVFCRDRRRFVDCNRELKIVAIRTHSPFRYLISGGFTLKQLLPGFTYPLIKCLELLLFPLNDLIAMFMTVEIQKNNK